MSMETMMKITRSRFMTVLLSLVLLVGLLPVGASAAGGSLALEAGNVTASAEAGTTVGSPSTPLPTADTAPAY